MERHQHGFTLIFSIVGVLGLVSFASCVAAEFKKSKRKDLKLDGRLCYLPSSRAFELGITALAFLFVAQLVGNVIVCRQYSCTGGQRRSCKNNKSTVTGGIFLLFSWVSFLFAVILTGVATSMNREQPFGEGWLDGDCYIVKDGVYAGSSILIFVAVASCIISAVIGEKRKKSQAEPGQKVHAQVE